jgi:hypothetical protein
MVRAQSTRIEAALTPSRVCTSRVLVEQALERLGERYFFAPLGPMYFRTFPRAYAESNRTVDRLNSEPD